MIFLSFIKKLLHLFFQLMLVVALVATTAFATAYYSGFLKNHFPQLNCLISRDKKDIVDQRNGGIRVLHMRSDCTCDTIYYTRQEK